MPFDLTTRAEYVRLYLESGQSQPEFCAAHPGGPSPRTLRSWLSVLSKPAGFTAEARAIVARAVADLQHLLQALDAVEHAQVVHGRSATRAAALPTVPEPAAADRRPEDLPGGSGAPQRTLLDDIAAAVQAAVASGDGVATQADTDEEQVAVRPTPFADPWTRGGGFLGPF